MRRTVLAVGILVSVVGLAPAAGAAPADARIAFTSTRHGGHEEIMTMAPLGGDVRRLTHQRQVPADVTVSVGGPDWSPNRSRILFHSGGFSQFQGGSAIELVAANGTGRTTVVSDGVFQFDGGQVSGATWAPGGRRIAYVHVRLARFQHDESLIVLNLRTGQGRAIDTIELGGLSSASWSPDGRRLAVVRTSLPVGSGVQELVVHDLVAGTEDVLAAADQLGGGPEWSPDGSTIVFGRGGQLYTVPAEGGDEVPLTTGAGPRWSPDSSTIAFTRDDQIHVIGRDGSDEQPLTTEGRNSDPDWSGDGSKIAFTSDRDGNREIYLMDADGHRQRNLTHNRADDAGPDWRPRLVQP